MIAAANAAANAGIILKQLQQQTQGLLKQFPQQTQHLANPTKHPNQMYKLVMPGLTLEELVQGLLLRN